MNCRTGVDPSKVKLEITESQLMDKVEDIIAKEQRRFLAQNGCRAYQGYLFNRPLPLSDFERLLPTTRGERAMVVDSCSRID